MIGFYKLEDATLNSEEKWRYWESTNRGKVTQMDFYLVEGSIPNPYASLILSLDGYYSSKSFEEWSKRLCDYIALDDCVKTAIRDNKQFHYPD